MIESIVLLTGNGCPACKMLKNRLEPEGLLTDIPILNIHEDEEAQDLANKVKLRGIPALVRTDSKGEHTLLVGASHPLQDYKDFINV